MPVKNIFRVSQGDRNQFCTNIIESSAPRSDFYFLVILSALITALGLLADNVVLLIGGMMVAPLLSPILALALGIVINESKVIWRSVRIFLVSFLFVFCVGLLLGFFSVTDLSSITLIQKMQANLFMFFIAAIAGLASSYTWVKPGLSGTLSGVAVTVTLIPPLTAVGLAAADGEWGIFSNVIKVLLLNVFGIVVASLIVFSLMDFYRCKKKVVAEVKAEEKEIEKEKEAAEKNSK